MYLCTFLIRDVFLGTKSVFENFSCESHVIDNDALFTTKIPYKNVCVQVVCTVMPLYSLEHFLNRTFLKHLKNGKVEKKTISLD